MGHFFIGAMMKKKSKLQKKIDDPTSRLWRNKADKAWKELVFLKAEGKCAYCFEKEYVQAHHLIPREILQFRHKVTNGILLCCSHHKYSFLFSAHKNPVRFAIWLQENDPERWVWLRQAVREIPEEGNFGEKPNYKEIYLSLQKALDELNPKGINMCDINSNQI